MPRYAILGVEGQHDQAFITKLLRNLGFQNFSGIDADLDPFWRPLVPTYPKGGKHYVRMDMPAIISTSDISVAIYSAEGSNLREKFPATFVNHPIFTTGIAAFGIIADSDNSPCAGVATAYASVYQGFFPQFPNAPGIVDLSPVRTGIFVFPDNVNQGTLENVILECANIVYPDLQSKAQVYLSGIDRTMLKCADVSEINKPAGEKKALASCISSVLKPGKTIQTSIQDNRWLEPRTLLLPSVINVTNFLKQLLSI